MGDFFSANASWSPEHSEEMKRFQSATFSDVASTQLL